MISVSTWFRDQLWRSGSPPLQRRCLFCGSRYLFDGARAGEYDLSPYVDRWPTISIRGGSLTPPNVSVTLNRPDPRPGHGTFAGEYVTGFRVDGNAWMDAFSPYASLKFQIGLKHANSPTEWATLFGGRVTRIDWSLGQVKLSARGSDLQLEDTYIGDESDSGFLFCGCGLSADTADWRTPAEIAWAVCSNANLLMIASTENPDIDWTRYAAWRDTFSSHAQLACGYFTGQSAARLLNEIAGQTHSIIAIGTDGRLLFARKTGALGAGDMLVAQDALLDMAYYCAREDRPNHAQFMTRYNVLSKSWPFDAPVDVYQSSLRIKYGNRTTRFESDNFFYMTDCGASINGCQVVGIGTGGTMPAGQNRYFLSAQAVLPLHGAILEISDTMRIVDSWMGITSSWASDSVAWLVMNKAVDMQNIRVTLDLIEREEWRDPY